MRSNVNARTHHEVEGVAAVRRKRVSRSRRAAICLTPPEKNNAGTLPYHRLALPDLMR